MPGLIDEVFVRIRPEVAGFAAETTAGIRSALTEVNAQVAAGAKANAAAAGAEIDANKAVAGSYLGIAEAAQAPVRSMAEIKAAAIEQQATVAAVAQANVAQLVIERDANIQLAASYETIANAAVQGSEKQIAASKLAAEAAIRAGVQVKAAAVEESAALNGVKTHLLSLGNILGVGFGAAIGIHFVKDIVTGAAESERAVEAIRSRFGGASEAVLRFGQNAARSLGVSAALADDTSARFGQLFGNLGFGQRAAAQMTLGFEKLAGSLSAIKGVDPTQAMDAVTTAASGNTRGLRQLGIVVDAASMKQAIFGKSAALVTGPLTAAERTLAIYRIATRQLGFDMGQVSAHSGDLAFQQRKLAAEFSNAKSALGEALLPAFTQYTTELADWLGRMEKSGRLQRDFNSIAQTARGVIDAVVGAIKTGAAIWSAFAHEVGGAKNAVEILLGVLVVSKFASIGNSVITLGGNIAGIGKAAMGAARTFGIATGIIEAESVGAAAIIDSALIATGIGAIVVAIGLATTYIITHWDQVKRYTVALAHAMAEVWHGVTGIVIGYYEILGGSFLKYVAGPITDFFSKLAGYGSGLLSFFGFGGVADKLNALKDALASVSTAGGHLLSSGFSSISQGASAFGNIGQAWSDSLAKSASSPDAKGKMKKAGGELGQSLADGVAGAASNLTKPLKPVLTALHNAIESARSKIHQTVMDAKDNLVKIGDELAKTIDKIHAKIAGAAGAIAGSPQGQAFAKLKQLIESGAPSFEISRARDALSSQLQNVAKTTSPQSRVKRDLDDLTSAFNRGKITYAEFQNRLHKILREDGVTMGQALKVGGAAFANTMKAQVAALGKQAQAIAAIPAKFRGIGGAGGAADIKIIRPLDVIRQEQAKIGAAAQHQREQQIRYAREMVKYQAKLVEQQAQEHRARVTAARAAATEAHARRARKAADDLRGPEGPRGAMGAPRRHDSEGPGRPAGPRGPFGAPAVREHLDRIHTGIVRETAAAGAHHRQQVTALHGISSEVGRLGGRFAAVEEAHVSQPLNILHQDNVRIAAAAAHQREALLKAQQRTNAELRGLRRYGPAPGFGKYPHGTGSKDARMGAKTGNRA
jgi:hypothetical protein